MHAGSLLSSMRFNENNAAVADRTILFWIMAGIQKITKTKYRKTPRKGVQ